MRSNHQGWLLLLTTLLLLTLAGCGSGSAPSGQAVSAAPAPITPPAAPPSTPAGLPTVLTVEHQVDVLAQRDGEVLQILKDEGGRVKAGDVLAQLDDRDLQAQLEKDRDDLKVAQYNVQYNEAELKAQQAHYKRQQLLREAGLGSQADLEQAEFLAKGAEYDLDSWHAAVEKCQAEIRATEVALDKTRVRSPFDGVVARRYIRQGQGIARNDKLFEVSQMSPLLVVFSIPENAGAAPRVGLKVSVVVGESGNAYQAAITKLSPTIDPGSDAYDATAQLTGRNLSALRPGMAARVVWPPSNATGRTPR
jgi:RND family efflux transporter MFP subunit